MTWQFLAKLRKKERFKSCSTIHHGKFKPLSHIDSHIPISLEEKVCQSKAKSVLEYKHTRLNWTDQCWTHKIKLKDTAEIVCRFGIKMTELYSFMKDDSQLCRAISCFHHKAFLVFLTGSKLPNITHCMNSINQSEKRET